MEVGPGEVTTYGDLARAAGIEGGARAVGGMMNANPFPGIVPCHRVVMSDGRVGGFAYGQGAKEQMLRREGLPVEGGRIAEFKARRHRF